MFSDPVPENTPQLFADERGIWREDAPGRRFGIEWSDIFRLSGYRLDGIDKEPVCVELDFEYGHFFELLSDWPGFQNVIAAISERLPGLCSNWFEDIERSGPARTLGALGGIGNLRPALE